MFFAAFDFENDRVGRSRRVGRQDDGGRPRSKLPIIVAAILALLVLVALGSTGFYIDLLWFRSLGFEGVYLTILQTQALLFVLGFAVFLILFLLNVRLARAIMARANRAFPFPLEEVMVSDRAVGLVVNGIAIVLALIMATAAASNWQVFLLFRNATAFGSTDPVFGQDVGFYFFSLPFYRLLQNWLLGALFVTLIALAVVYVFDFRQQRLVLNPLPAMKAHLSLIGAAIILLFAIGYRLDIFDLVYSTRGGIFAGASYTDVNAKWGALDFLTVVAVITVALLLVNVFRRGAWLPAFSIGAWFVAAILVGSIYPAVVQQFQVIPSQLSKEQPYIMNNIKMTRQAFGLDSIAEQSFPAEDAVKVSDIQADVDTVSNIRLWDEQPLIDTYNQIQSIRLYYDFHDVDFDRYVIDGNVRQVALSARELSPQKIAQQAQTWVNQRLQYTHGYGAVVSPVAGVSGEGLPQLAVKDIPPSGVPEISRPEIYFGEVNGEYVIVNAKTQEFDYPKGDENAYSEYAGQGGVRINSWLRKLAFAWRFADGNIWFTGYLTPDSRVLYYRSIQDRVHRIAPFLMLDSDPYLVIADGRLVWIQDAYTFSSQYPYAQPFTMAAASPQERPEQFNYIRNSVKAVIDAYDGTVRLYVSDPNDPLVQSYGRIFPSLFTDLASMPPAVRTHLRYPEYLFSVQAEMYRTYHMQDPQVLYNSEDLWSIPQQITNNVKREMRPYYLNMRLPGETNTEFLLMSPFTPSNKDNMIAWLAARSDGENYGKLVSYKFPKDKLVYGPMQLEARIDQDPTISSQLTLWSQRGSRVIRGNLLVIPVGKSILYVEPIYLQAETSHLPELKRVIAATGNRLSMEASLTESLSKVFDQNVTVPGLASDPSIKPSTPSVSTAPTSTLQPVTAEIRALSISAANHYAKAQEYLKAGDWARYGEEQRALEQDLQQLGKLTSP